MEVILGIDVGGSTTKIVGYQRDGLYIGARQVTATDQITSLYGAVGNLLSGKGIPLKDVSKIIVTGVGAHLIHGDIYDIPTQKVQEFQAIGIGGLALTGKEEALVVSMGTGTAYVRATREKISHIGGSGVGGGTLLGLSEKLIGERGFDQIHSLAQQGNLNNIDLAIQDIFEGDVQTLPPDLTASNFGKVRSSATNADLTLGLINMVLQTIGMLAIFACRNDTIKDVVLTGTLTTMPQTKQVFESLQTLHNINFIVPEQAVFATAIGAAIPHVNIPLKI